MTLPEINEPLLRSTLEEVIQADAYNLWTQYNWADASRTYHEQAPEGMCKTPGCYAGRLAMNDGYTQYEPGFDRNQLINPDTQEKLFTPGWGDTADHGFLGDVSDRESVPGYAMSRLGLTKHEAEVLFHADNEISDLKQIVDDIIAGKYR